MNTIGTISVHTVTPAMKKGAEVTRKLVEYYHKEQLGNSDVKVSTEWDFNYPNPVIVVTATTGGKDFYYCYEWRANLGCALLIKD
ncbi:MAG: hypothetical protein IIT64_03670 [Bacteroidaceae bacterium]|nr:hypothetical protein [Bacteroidaceae bacterium]